MAYTITIETLLRGSAGKGNCKMKEVEGLAELIAKQLQQIENPYTLLQIYRFIRNVAKEG